MPTFEFQCKKCKTVYEERTSFDETGKYPSVICPKCSSKSKIKLISACGFSFSNPVGTDRYNNSHDYRFHHKLPSVIAERQAAEIAAAQNPTPYEAINDLNTDAAWGSDGGENENEIQL